MLPSKHFFLRAAYCLIFSQSLCFLLHPPDAAHAQESTERNESSRNQPNTAADLVVPVWPVKPPTWNAPEQPEFDRTSGSSKKIADRPLMRLTNVATPELHVFLPSSHPVGNAKHTTVVIAPGGGYSILAWDLEGTEIANWLREMGITAIVLKYRVPSTKENQKWLPAVQDLQRSISLVRGKGIAGVTPDRVGVMGFSAGGNAAARVAASTQRFYEPIDKFDEQLVVPDFAVLIYPAWLVEDGTTLIKELNVTSETPPMFMAHAADDPVTCLNSVGLFTALQEKGVTSELHVFSSGGHGFGGRRTGAPTDAWKSLCRAWLATNQWISP